MIAYAGCPLGLNGCNAFDETKEKKGFFFVKWILRITNDEMPEDVIYIVCSTVGGLVLAVLFSCLPEHLHFQIRGGGTIQALVAVAAGERIRITAAVIRLFATSIYLGSGGTLGMDGPAIQVCTAATTFLGYKMGMRSVPTQSLLASLGFAGGFAATFNSPLAGIMFAMEELQHVSSRLSRHIICVILMASIVATMVSRAFQSGQPLLDTQWDQDLIKSVGGGSINETIGTKMWMLVSVPIGILCSLAGLACSRLIRWGHIATRKLEDRQVPDSVLYVTQSVLVALIGSFVFRTTGLRGVWGIGYESLQASFNREFHAYEYLIVTVGKLLAMVLAVLGRAPGDILEPVLLAGAFLGGAVGSFLEAAISDPNLAKQVMKPCLVFGMVGLFASCFRFPLTPVVIVLELMGVETYSLVLPAALSGFTAITASNRLFPPLLDEIMHEDDIDLHELSKEADVRAAEEAMDPDDIEAANWMEDGMIQATPEPAAIRVSRASSYRSELEMLSEEEKDIPSPKLSSCKSSDCPESGETAELTARRPSNLSNPSYRSEATSQESACSAHSGVLSATGTAKKAFSPRVSTKSLGNMFANIESSVLALSAPEAHHARKRRLSPPSVPGGNVLGERRNSGGRRFSNMRTLSGPDNKGKRGSAGRLSMQQRPSILSAGTTMVSNMGSFMRRTSALSPRGSLDVEGSQDYGLPSSSQFPLAYHNRKCHSLDAESKIAAMRAAVQARLDSKEKPLPTLESLRSRFHESDLLRPDSLGQKRPTSGDKSPDSRESETEENDPKHIPGSLVSEPDTDFSDDSMATFDKETVQTGNVPPSMQALTHAATPILAVNEIEPAPAHVTSDLESMSTSSPSHSEALKPNIHKDRGDKAEVPSSSLNNGGPDASTASPDAGAAGSNAGTEPLPFTLRKSLD